VVEEEEVRTSVAVVEAVESGKVHHRWQDLARFRLLLELVVMARMRMHRVG
jgi:hypothetical protein